jgi:anion-transporting  ArsA/GET3 family ATPase
VVDLRGLSRFFHAAPGVVEVATFALVHRLVTARKPRWDPVIVDLDATGHAVMMLELPTVLDAIVGEGPLRTLLDRTSGLLRDPARTALHLVTLPASLPVDETLELYERLAGAGVAALGSVIVNRMPLARFTDSDAGELRSLALDAVARRDDRLAADVALGQRALAAHRHAAAQRRRLDVLPLPVFELPEAAPGESGRLDLEAIVVLGRGLRSHRAEASS